MISVLYNQNVGQISYVFVREKMGPLKSNFENRSYAGQDSAMLGTDKN